MCIIKSFVCHNIKHAMSYHTMEFCHEYRSIPSTMSQYLKFDFVFHNYNYDLKTSLISLLNSSFVNDHYQSEYNGLLKSYNVMYRGIGSNLLVQRL